MAIITATKGIKTAFSGGSDEIVCVFSPAARNGVQIESEGFTLNLATIEVKGSSMGDADEVSVANAIHVATINGANGKSIIGEVRIKSVASGTYFVTFTDI